VEERRVAERRQRFGDTPAGAHEGGALIGDGDARLRAPLYMLLDLVGKVVHVDHRALDPGLRQTIEHVIDQRLAGDLHQRLGDLAIEGTHAGAEAGGQHHGARRLRAARSLSFPHPHAPCPINSAAMAECSRHTIC